MTTKTQHTPESLLDAHRMTTRDGKRINSISPERGTVNVRVDWLVEEVYDGLPGYVVPGISGRFSEATHD